MCDASQAHFLTSVAGAAGAAMLILTGCTAAPAEPTVETPGWPASPSSEWAAWRPVVGVTPVRLSEAEAEARRIEHLAALAEHSGLTIGEPPPLVRWVSPDEFGPAMADCLTSAGFPATSNADRRGYQVDSQAEQGSALTLAEFDCTAKFTIDARLLGGGPAGWESVLWEYANDFLVPCMAEHGYQPQEVLPTRDVFIRDPVWEAYPSTLTATQREQLSVECPASPPFAALVGE